MRSEYAGHDHTHGMAKQTLRLAFFLSLIIFECDGHPGKCSDIDGFYCQMEETHDHLQAEATVSPIEKGS